MRPGRVLEVLENGNIKADVPGLFSVVDQEKLPPIMPFPAGHSNAFSEPKVFEEVWVLNFNDNPLQLYWFRKDRFIVPDAAILGNGNVEIVCNREIGPNQWATIYFSDGSGWLIQNGESYVQIRPDGSICLNSGYTNRVIDIGAESISLGSVGKSAHRAAYGDTIMEILADLCGLLNAAAKAGMTNPYTTVMAQKIQSNLPKIEDAIQNVSSPHVTLD